MKWQPRGGCKGDGRSPESRITGRAACGSAVGSQGDEYVLDESHSEEFAFGDYTFDYRAQLISQGSAPDEVLLVHYDPDSGLTFETECSD